MDVIYETLIMINVLFHCNFIYLLTKNIKLEFSWSITGSFLVFTLSIGASYTYQNDDSSVFVSPTHNVMFMNLGVSKVEFENTCG